MQRNITFTIMALLTVILFIGCSGGGNITAPVDNPAEMASAASADTHYLWGYWQGIIDPDAQTIDFVRLREGNFHLNALGFLEPPPLALLSLEGLEFNGDLITADIGLRHPFLGLTEFTGFDVCGIFISNGSISGFSDTDLIMAGDGDTRLLNPDGYSRWWNPSEFPINGTIFGYIDGLLGSPDSYAEYNSTLNAYKYYSDDVGQIEATFDDVIPENRGMFSAGQKNVRRFEIELGTDGLMFNYAIDACWSFPVEDPPYTAPDDFAPEANRVEAWNITISELENTLYNDGVDSGGNLGLSIDVYDWYNAGLNTVRVESPGNFAMVESATPIAGGSGYSTYEIDITSATPAAGSIDLLISIISEEENWQEFISGVNTTAYFTQSVEVSGEPPMSYHWEFDTISTTASYSHPEYNDLGPAIIEEADGDIGLTFAADRPDDVAYPWSHWHVRYSTNNGASYGNELLRDTGTNIHRGDHNKIWQGQLNDSWATSKFWNGNNLAYVARVEPFSTNRGVFISNTQGNIEVLLDELGFIYCFDDAGDNIQMKHSQAPNDIAPWTWHKPPYEFFNVATGGECSHSRSVGIDSSNVLWLAYYDTAQTQIRLAHSTGTSPHTTWDASTVAYTAGTGISQVINPSLWIDGDDNFHLCYTRLDSVSGNYQLVYTVDDSAFDDPTELVIAESPSAIKDAHVSVGEKFGQEVVILIYETSSSVYLATLINGEILCEPEELDNNTDDIDPDAILDADECDLHSIWSTMDGTNYDLAIRNGVLVED